MPPPPQNPIVGLWEATDGSYCAVAFDFKADSSYGESRVCTLSNGSIGAQVADGNYYTYGGIVTLDATEATCVGWAKVSSANYQLVGASLILSDSTVAITFSRSTPSGNGTVVYGCFDSSGNFTASPLAAL